MKNQFWRNKKFLLILLCGFILRLAFILLGAELYFNRTNIFIDADTYAWTSCFENLIKHGNYTLNNNEYGYFVRTPGYSFFIGIFYLLLGKNWDLAFPAIACAQIILDCGSIYLIYRIGHFVYQNEKTALIIAFIYAAYPFIIVWNPVVYSESTSIFFILLSIFYLLNSKPRFNLVLSSLFLSIAILTRLQTILFFPCAILYLFLINRHSVKTALLSMSKYSFIFLLIYGSWPARNYFLHDKLIFTQDLRGVECWQEDVISFLQYTYAVKAEHQPQFNQIIHGKKVTYPKEAYLTTEDSLKLEEALKLAQECGSGFSNWPGYWKEKFGTSNCNTQISKLFNELRESQISKNPFNFYLKVPLTNLKKALFKSNLTNSNGRGFKSAISSVLFIYRSLIILLGLTSTIMLLKYRVHWHNNPFILIIFLYMASTYFLLCFGTTFQTRNIEMRYFLPCDVLLLIPASYLLFYFHDKLQLSFLKVDKHDLE